VAPHVGSLAQCATRNSADRLRRRSCSHGIQALSRGVMAQLLLAEAVTRPVGAGVIAFLKTSRGASARRHARWSVLSRRLVGVGGDDRSRAKAAASACASRARRATWTRRPSQALEGRTLKQSYVRHLPRRLADEAGVERRLHPHALRHTYAANGSRGHADSCAIRSAKPPWRHGPIAMGRGPCPRHRNDDAQGVELGGEGLAKRLAKRQAPSGCGSGR
jgi:hypothetical protein